MLDISEAYQIYDLLLQIGYGNGMMVGDVLVSRVRVRVRVNDGACFSPAMK